MQGKNRGLHTHEHHQELIKKAIDMLSKGKMINAKSLGVYQIKMKTIIMTIRKDHGLDILTVNRGRVTIGWVLASEFLK